MPKGGFGNLIALPLQFDPRKQGNSVFLDADFAPYPDQWAYLFSVKRLPTSSATAIVAAGDDQSHSPDCGISKPRVLQGAGHAAFHLWQASYHLLWRGLRQTHRRASRLHWRSS